MRKAALHTLISLLIVSPLAMAAPPVGSSPPARVPQPPRRDPVGAARPQIAPYRQITKVAFIPGDWLTVGTLAVELSDGDGVPESIPIQQDFSGCAFRTIDAWTVQPRALTKTGYLFNNTNPTSCEIKVAVSMKRASGEVYVARGAFAIPMAERQRVRISDTARLRDWLRPRQGLGCTSDDSGGKLGIRITTGPAGANCRADFMTAANRNPAEGSGAWFNALPPAVFLARTVWKLEGDTSQCQLCSDPTKPCREPLQTLAQTLQTFRAELIGPVVHEGENSGGLGVFADPGTMGDNVDVFYGGALGVRIGRNVDKRYREWLNEWYSEMSCSPWVPPVSDVVSGVASAAERVAQGQAPNASPPSPPTLRLVLDAIEFTKPPSATLPF